MRTIALAASIAVVQSLAPWSAEAADFSHAKRTYVPATAYDRRVDFTTMRDYQAVSSSVPPASRPTTKYSMAPRSTPTKSAAAPPPPPDLAKTAKQIQGQIKKAASNPQVQAAVASFKKKAAELAQSGKFEEAKQMAARALAMSPQDKAVLKGMAVASLDRAKQFVQSADFDKALQYAREALAYDGNNIDAKKLVDGLLIKSGMNPNDPDQRLRNADLLLSQGRNDEAFVEYNTAAKLKPSAEAKVGIGNVALRAGQKDRAKSEYHAALDVDPNSSVAYRQLGYLKLGQGDIVGANAALSRALVLNPKDRNAAKSLVDLWQQQVSKVPGANSHLGLARAYQLSGDLQSAQAEYRTVVRLDPENTHLPAARQSFKLALARQEADKAVEAARTLEAHNDIPDAYQKVHEAVKLSPGDAELRVYQGLLLEKLQRYTGAREAYLNALKINPRHGLAAERLRALPPDAVAIAPELATPPAQTFIAPNAVAGASNGVPSAVGHDPVQNISNFAVALRNQMLVQKAQSEQVEDAAHSILKQVGAAAAGTAEAPAAAAVAATAAPAAAPAADAAADLGVGGSVSEALSSAAAAIAAAKGLVHGKGATAPATAAPAAAAAASTAAAIDTPPPFGKLGKTAQQVDSLRQQNQALQDQLKKMRDALTKLKGQPAATTATMTDATPTIAAPTSAMAPLPPVTSPIPDPTSSEIDKLLANAGSPSTTFGSATPTMISETLPPLAPPIAQSMGGLQAMAPQIDPNAAALPPAGAPLRQPISVPNIIRLELENASPKLGSVELSVILRNDGDASFLLPTSKLRAVINYSNRRPAEVKATFSDGTVPPHGAIRGVIRVPFDKVDPTADLVIPELLPAGSPQRDIHLITSMAYR